VPVFEAQTGIRVQLRNLVGAGGTLGIRAIANARPESMTLGIVNPISLIDSQQLGLQLPSNDDLLMLGSFIFDTAIGVAREVADIQSSTDSIRVVGVVDTELVRTLLATRALGWNARFVRGYTGSSERWLALLRGDIDASFGTTESLENYLRGSPEVQPFVSLTEGPNPVFPDIPYLAGAGGLVDLTSRDLPAAERESRMDLARLTADLSVKPRSIAVSSKISETAQKCLAMAVERTLFSPELELRLQRQGLGLEPIGAAETEAVVDRVIELLNNNKDLLAEIIAAQESR